jgi:AcrR family transcriptional regulator
MKDKRNYKLNKRADSLSNTRQKIVEATMQLHEELGPRNTTISAIAERAGVQRLTVYRHFEDEVALFQACTSHWLYLNPPPNPSDWMSETIPEKRFSLALLAIYEYYSATQRMWLVSYRDVGEVTALQIPMTEFESYLNAIKLELIKAFNCTFIQEKKLMLLTGLALHFTTWSNLDIQKVSDPDKVTFIVSCLKGIL